MEKKPQQPQKGPYPGQKNPQQKPGQPNPNFPDTKNPQKKPGSNW